MASSPKSSAISPQGSAVSRLESAIADGQVEVFDGSFSMTRADGTVEHYLGKHDFHAPVKVASRDIAAQNDLTEYVKSLGALAKTEEGLAELSRICTPIAPKSNAELAWDMELMETRMRVLNQAMEHKLAQSAVMLSDMSGQQPRSNLQQQYELDVLRAEVKQLKELTKALLELANARERTASAGSQRPVSPGGSGKPKRAKTRKTPASKGMGSKGQ